VTLDEMLALLPDNTSGEVSAADLRAIVTDLHALASTVGQVFSYLWVNTPGPGAGKLTMPQPWDDTAVLLQASETTNDGEAVSFGLVDAGGGRVRLIAAGGTLDADITGPSLDQGGYRDVPIVVTRLTGVPPSNNEKITVVVLVTP